jgi:hypothetical protein
VKPFLVLAALSAAVFTTACDSLTGGGTKKVIVNEQVCATVAFLNMKVGEETRIILDNSEHSEELTSLGLVLDEFPMVITSEFRPDAEVGPTYTSVSLYANAGDEDEITVEPTFTGNYAAQCQLTYSRPTGDVAVQQDLTFQIVN